MIPGLKFKYRVLFFPFVFMSYKSYYYFGNHILNKYNLRKGEKHGNGDKKKYCEVREAYSSFRTSHKFISRMHAVR